jgi:hypothetical protein
MPDAGPLKTAFSCCGIPAPEKTLAAANEELGRFIVILMKRCNAQATYDLFENVLTNRVKQENVPGHAMRVGLVSAIGEYLGWDCDTAAKICVDILHDVNYHDAARKLEEFIS